ncbi:hypothetical protein [Sphingomonas pokkalii]|uniref:hypothetical protein n=1 Tax=Sphingomonas pokkalii TaxID=2175090 RepID=UPI001402D7F9|nr:hypothetical protein [Sphingomonas pokkalii]
MGRHAALKGLSVPQAIEAGKRLKIESIKPATINRAYLAHIAALFKWALKEGWITSTPFTGLAVSMTPASPWSPARSISRELAHRAEP